MRDVPQWQSMLLQRQSHRELLRTHKKKKQRKGCYNGWVAQCVYSLR